MKRLLAAAGALALLAWTGAGLVAWAAVARRVTVVLSDGEPRADAPRDAELAEELSALRADVRALADALGESMRALDDTLAERERLAAAELDRSIESLRGEIERAATSGPSPGPEVAFEPAPAEPVAPAADEAAQEAVPAPPVAARRSFLAFALPSDDLSFEGRRAWSVLPALSRVGFDAQTTLHDFSGTTSALEGSLDVDLARPAEGPSLVLRVEAAALATGEPGRDEAMLEHLAAAEHPRIEFELTAFEPSTVEPELSRGAGRARGRMTIRGVAREVAMDVRYSLDASRRLCVDGEMPLDLRDFGVPVPSKLGLITMESEVRAWISLKLRAKPGAGS